jgi:hypothetical protein
MAVGGKRGEKEEEEKKNGGSSDEDDDIEAFLTKRAKKCDGPLPAPTGIPAKDEKDHEKLLEDAGMILSQKRD